MTQLTTTERSFTLVRHLDAPRELVFQAWTEPAELIWFANTPPTDDDPITVDLRVGGQWRLHMVENEERSYWTGGVYREIAPPTRLAFVWGAVDGWPALDPARPQDGPVVVVTLEELDGGTEMTVQVSLADHLTQEEVEGWFALGIVEGWTDTLERLAPSR